MQMAMRPGIPFLAALAVFTTAGADVLDVTALGAKRDGSTDVSEIANSNTHKGALFFPAGLYRVEHPLVLKNPIRGEGYSRSRNMDASRTWLVSGIDCDDGTAGVMEFGGDAPMNVENLNVMCNSRECGIRVADCRQGTYTFIDKVGIFNCAACGVYVKGRGSRPMFLGNMTIFGATGDPDARATGIRLEGMADCRLSNIEIMGTSIGLELLSGHTYGDNLHLWTGAMGKRGPGWWKSTRGIVVGRDAHFTGSEIYPDTCYHAFDMLGEGSFCEIRNIMVWEDRSVAGEADRGGSFVRYADPRRPGRLAISGGLVGVRGNDKFPGAVSKFYSPSVEVRDVILKSDYAITGANMDSLCLGRALPDYTVRYADKGWCKVADVFTVANTGSCAGVLTIESGASWRIALEKGSDACVRMAITPLNALCDGREIAGIEEDGVFKVYIRCPDAKPMVARFVTESMCDRFRPLDHGVLRSFCYGSSRYRDVRETLADVRNARMPGKWPGFACGMGIGGWLTNYKRFNVLPEEQRLKITVGDLEHFDSYITESDIVNIKSMGFDHIRLGFDQIVLEESPGRYRERTFRKIDDFIGWCGKHKMNVVLNLHKAIGNYCDIKEKIELLDDDGLQRRFIDLWIEFERRYHDFPGLAFELLNEVRDVDPKKWNDLADRTLRAIREKNPDRWVVVGSTCWNSADTLKDLKVWDDPKVVYTFHMYTPFEFTHQRGVLQADTLYYNRTMEYPSGDVERYRDYNRLHGKDGGYRDVKAVDREFLKACLRGALDFAEEHPDKILWNGEFGTIRHAPPGSRVAYMRDVVSICKEAGIPWCVWNYLSTPNDGNRFSLVDDDTRRILSPELLEACLGMAY